MNLVVYEQLKFNSGKNLFIYDCLANKSNSISNLILGLTIKQVKFKHNNVFVNKFVKLKHFSYSFTIYEKIIS